MDVKDQLHAVNEGGSDQGAGAKAGLAVLYSGLVDQSDFGAGVDPVWLQRTKSCGGDRLLDGRSCHW